MALSFALYGLVAVVGIASARPYLRAFSGARAPSDRSVLTVGIMMHKL